MIIGIFELYIQLLPIYELYIIPWSYILLKQSQPGTLYQEEDMELMQSLCNIEGEKLLERLNKDIL